MAPRGKLMAMEGIDGSGKGTQIGLLCRLLEQRDVPYARFSFPRYNTFFGQLVARFLNGEFGALNQVDPHFSALLFAGDRLETREELEHALEEGKTVVADRYIASNLAHQTARVAAEKREEFLEWLKELEYEVYGLPAETLVVYLRLPAAQAQALVSRKAARDYTPLRQDLQEADLAHLSHAAQVYDQLARQPRWVTVECFDASAAAVLAPEEIHRRVVAAIEEHAPFLLRRAKGPKSRPHGLPRR